MLESALDAELDAHLDDAGVDEAMGRRVNIRNGHGAKTVRTEVSWWRGMGAGEPGSESAGPRLPPENPCQELTNSDQEEQVFDRVDAAQGLLATSDDMPGVTTVGNKGSSVRIRPSRRRSEAIRYLPDGLFRSCTAAKYSNGSLIEALTELPQGFPGGLG
nr:hypothetical protein [Salinispora sp. H7-4]